MLFQGLVILMLLGILGTVIAVVVRQDSTKTSSRLHAQHMQHLSPVTQDLRDTAKQVRELEGKVDSFLNAFHAMGSDWRQVRHMVFEVDKSFKRLPLTIKRAEQTVRFAEPGVKDASVTVLVPVFNGIEFLGECLQSVADQTTLPEKVIVGVNGHANDSAEVKQVRETVDPYMDKLDIEVRVWPEPNKVITLNKMVPLVQTDYVALIDVDDSWLPTKLEVQLRAAADHNLDVIGTSCNYFGERTGQPNLVDGLIKPIDLYLGNQLVNSSVLIKTELAYWNPAYSEGLEDYELWLRLAYKACTLFNCPEALVMHRIHKGSHFNTKSEQADLLQRLQKEFLF